MKETVLHTYINKIFLFLLFAGTFLASGCKTSSSNSDNNPINTENTEFEKKSADLENTINHLKFRIDNLEEDNTISKKTIAALQSDLQSQQEEISTQKKNIEILKRGIRSGIFEDFPEDKIPPAKNSSLTTFPNISEGRSGFTENNADFLLNTKLKNTLDDEPIGPKQLLANAEIKIRKDKYKEGLIELDELRKKYPNFEDQGHSNLLCAEAWLKLKEFNNVIPEIRSFYLKYPTSADLAYAKLLEAKAYEGNGSFVKAAALYSEVISLSPNSSLSQESKNGMLRMSDQK